MRVNVERVFNGPSDPRCCVLLGAEDPMLPLLAQGCSPRRSSIVAVSTWSPDAPPADLEPIHAQGWHLLLHRSGTRKDFLAQVHKRRPVDLVVLSLRQQYSLCTREELLVLLTVGGCGSRLLPPISLPRRSRPCRPSTGCPQGAAVATASSSWMPSPAGHLSLTRLASIRS